MNEVKIKIRDLNFLYDQKMILKYLSVELEERTITTVVGPSGAGKTTFLMALNRLYESIPNCTVTGNIEIQLNGKYVNIQDLPLTTLRKKVGMVFQSPNPLPMSIFKNVAFPLKLSGFKDKKRIREKVEKTLGEASLWEEVKDRLDDPAMELSGGQQQRLCIARAMILEPEALLLDEPTSSLDMEAASRIEELMHRLKEKCTLVVVSHYADMITKISDRILTLKDGRF